jgi:L-ascorbate metabolism protein UlaG (beta-lactamase superfamily)
MTRVLGVITVGTLVAASSIGLAPRLGAQTATPTPTSAQKKHQARPAATQPFGATAFESSDRTTIRWTGNAGFFINSRGTTFMIDPLLQGFDMPILIAMPILPKDVPRLDAVLVTHSDNDHYSLPTLRELAPVTRVFHSTMYVSSLMKTQGWSASGHGIGEVFTVGPVRVTLTPADHAWQNAMPPREGQRRFSDDDACGYWIETPDGVIWHPGDSRLMPQHLTMAVPDAILFDFSDNGWHFGLAGAAKLANAYPNTPLLLSHWGTVDAPDFTPFNGDPAKLAPLVVNPERIRVLAPGEPYALTRVKKP